jgi:hypothetical protein
MIAVALAVLLRAPVVFLVRAAAKLEASLGFEGRSSRIVGENRTF